MRSDEQIEARRRADAEKRDAQKKAFVPDRWLWIGLAVAMGLLSYIYWDSITYWF